MRHFAQTVGAGPEPRALCISVEGLAYWVSFRHIFLEEEVSNYDHGSIKEYSHDAYHIVLSEGDGEMSVDGRVFAVTKGSLILTSPGQPHRFQGRGCFVFHSVTFVFENGEGEVLVLPWNKVLEKFSGLQADIPQPPLNLASASCDTLRSLIFEMIDWMDIPSPVSHLMGQQTLARIVAFIVGVFVECHGKPVNDLVKAMEYLRVHFRDRLSIDRLSHIAGMSRAHFIRTFKRTYGDTPVSLQHKFRIEAAKTLLDSSELGCGEIGLLVGYSDPYQFSKMFRKITGRPPSQSRRQDD